MKQKCETLIISTIIFILFIAIIYISALCYKTPSTSDLHREASDTVWQIATEHCPNYHTGNVSMKIQQLNDIDGYIYPGEILIVPVEEGERN